MYLQLASGRRWVSLFWSVVDNCSLHFSQTIPKIVALKSNIPRWSNKISTFESIILNLSIQTSAVESILKFWMVDLRSLVISGLFSKPSIYLSHFSYFALKILLVGKKAHQDYMYWNWNWNELMKYIPIQINLRTIYLSSIFSDLPRFSVQLHSKLWIVE